MTAYLNFELGIFTAADGTYQAMVLDAPQSLPAEAPHHFFRLPYDEAELGRILGILSGGRNPRGRTRQDLAKEFGETLYNAVFGGPIHRAYQQARQTAEGQNKWLRIRLNLKSAGALTGLPWEYLREPNVDYLTLSKATPLVRYTEPLVSLPRPQTRLPLRILVMISNPADVPPLDEATERDNLLKATIRLQERGLVEVEFLEDASLRNLQRVLRQKEFHVFHYIGHSAYNTATQAGILIFEDPYDTSKSYPIRGEALARELYEENTLRLVVLNSCEGAVYNASDPFSGVASSLVQRGIPAVVAQQFEISDRAAIIFSEEFYRAVAEGFPLEAAVAEGRRAILSTLGNSDTVEWGTPVLFSHEDATTFDFSAAEAQNRAPWRRWLPQMAAVGVGLLLLLLVGLGMRGYGEEPIVSFPPPTATPIPKVDIAVRDVRLSPRNPKPGELVAVFVDVENKGSDPAPSFTYEWQGNIFDPATIVTRRVAGLAAEGVLHDSFLVRFGWWGVFIAETRVDTLNELVELSEQNKRPLPVRTDATQPFTIDFNEPLPNGQYVRQNQPVAFDAFDTWGFRIEAQKTSDPACREVVPWFKFIGISNLALGTGLPDNPDLCTDAALIITFFNPRSDNNLSGVSRVKVTFAPGTGRRTLQIFEAVNVPDPLATLSGVNSRTQGLTLQAQPEGFSKIYQVRLESQNTPVNLVSLVLTAP